MTADKKNQPDKSLTERLDKLQYNRGYADARAEHRPALFGGPYLEGYYAARSESPSEKEDTYLDNINEARFEYDLPPITQEELNRSQN